MAKNVWVAMPTFGHVNAFMTRNYCHSQLVSCLKQLEVQTEYLEATLGLDKRLEVSKELICECVTVPGCCRCMPLLHNHLMNSCKYVRKNTLLAAKGGCLNHRVVTWTTGAPGGQAFLCEMQLPWQNFKPTFCVQEVLPNYNMLLLACQIPSQASVQWSLGCKVVRQGLISYSIATSPNYSEGRWSGFKLSSILGRCGLVPIL